MTNAISDLISTYIRQEDISKKPVHTNLASIVANRQGYLKQTQTTTEKCVLRLESCIHQKSPSLITNEGYTARLKKTVSGFEAAVEDHRVPGLQRCSIMPVVFATCVCALELDHKPRLWQQHHLRVSWDEKQSRQVLLIGSCGLKGGTKECKAWFCHEPVFECCECGILSDLCYKDYRGTKPSVSTFLPLWNIGQFVGKLVMHNDKEHFDKCKKCKLFMCSKTICGICHDITFCAKCCDCRQLQAK